MKWLIIAAALGGFLVGAAGVTLWFLWHLRKVCR